MEKSTVDKKIFEKAIKEYQENPDVDSMVAIFEAFWIITESIIDYTKFIPPEKKHKAMVSGVCNAFIKIPRFNADKGKAFNYFTTVILCALRQEFRSHKNYQELKTKYEEKIKSDRSSRKKVSRS